MTDFKEKGTALDPFLKGREEHFSYVERILDSANTFKKIAVGATLVALVSSISAGYLLEANIFHLLFVQTKLQDIQML